MADRTPSPVTLKDIAEALSRPADTLILMHRNPDGDAVGSAFALRAVLEILGSRAWCLCDAEIPERLRFLSRGAQESVLPASVPFDAASARVIAVDVASPAQLGGLRKAFEGRTDLMIDHHATGTPFASLCYVDGKAAATGEILLDVVLDLESDGKLWLSPPIAEPLYAAISSDTGCFRYSNVTIRTHLLAAELVASEIDCAKINHLLFDSKSMSQLRAEAMGVQKLRVFYGGRVAVIAVSFEERQAAGLAESDMETLIDVARSLAGAEVAMTVRQPTDAPQFRVSTRSSGAFNVAKFCAGFGGGGHEKAAGCTVFAPNIDSAVELLIDSLDFSDQP